MTTLVQTKTGNGTGTTATVTLDATPTVGNTIVACHFSRGATVTAPAGWASYQAGIAVAETNPLTIAWRVVQSGDTGATFTLASAEWAMVVLEYSGLLSAQADLLDLAMRCRTSTSENVTTLGSGRTGTTDAEDELVISAVGLLGSNTWTGTWTDGFTERGTAASPAATTSKAVIAVADKILTDLGEPNPSTTWTTARRGIAATVTLRASAPVANPLLWAWSGGITHDAAQVVARLDDELDARLVVSTSADLSSPSYSTMETADADTSHVVRFNIDGLDPDTAYHYGVEVDGDIAPLRGQFHTFPTGPSSFTFALASCGGYRQNAEATTQLPMSLLPVWDKVEAHDPLFFLHMGDWHYQDVRTNVVADHVVPYHDVLTSQKQGPLWRRLPIVRTWSDHDYCGDGSVGSAVGRTAAIAAYLRCTPHYDIDNAGIHQAFTVGRVRIIMLDTQSSAASEGAPEDSSKTRLGLDGRQWLLDQLADAEADPNIGLVILNTGDPWISSAEEAWYFYSWERQHIADYIETMTTGVLGVAGDAHSLAIDDGTNNVWGGFPFFQAAALARGGSTKGGPYTSGEFENAQSEDFQGQFGLITITDEDGTITVDLAGQRVQPSGTESTVVTDSFEFDAPVAEPPTPTPGAVASSIGSYSSVGGSLAFAQ